MNRNRTGRSSEGTTLRDALSPMARDQLHRLRDTLRKQAREAIANQFAEARPPWGRQRKPNTAPEPVRKDSSSGAGRPYPAILSGHRPEPRKTKRREKQRSSRKPTGAPKLQKDTFKFWGFPNEAAVREPPPESISDADRAYFDDLLQAGNDSSTADGNELFLILGLDLGTSSTKMIVRLPYEPGEPTIAIPAPHPCRSGETPYLWQTVLWLREEGTFLPWPESGARVLNSLKQGLIDGRSETAIAKSATSVKVSRAQAAAAYLAFVIRYVRGWLLRNRSHLFLGRRPIWFVNLGMPAATYDDLNLANPYRRIGAAALQIAKFGDAITVEGAQLFLDDPDVMRAGASVETAEDLGIAVFPETAAEMTGFTRSIRSAPGVYYLVDVGAMTLDACLLRLDQDEDTGDLYSFMAAQVRPLGVDSFHWFLAEGKTKSEFVQQCERMLRAVVWKTKQRTEVPVFVAGGGAANRLHRAVVVSLGPWLERYAPNDGIRLLDLPVPSSIELPEPFEDFGRMAVAWGLSYPPTDIGRIRTMREIGDIPPPVAVDISERYISKDDV